MGIYIKNMEMPTNCFGCPFFTQVNYWNENNEADILLKCKRTGEFAWESVSCYLPNCPLIPIPEHGDLIDRSCLCDDSIGGDYGSGIRVYYAYEVEHAPVVIPAEKDK